jgi:hypothetical protein
MQMYGAAKIWLHAFLTSALERGEWSVSRFGRFTPEKRTPDPLDRRLGGPQSRSGRCDEEKILPCLLFMKIIVIMIIITKLQIMQFPLWPHCSINNNNNNNNTKNCK